MRADHIEARGRAMFCTRCEGVREINMPAKIDDIIKQMDSFRDAHVSCPPHTIEGEMSEYIKGFDAGCEHLMREIELYNKRTATPLHDLISHLRKGLK